MSARNLEEAQERCFACGHVRAYHENDGPCGVGRHKCKTQCGAFMRGELPMYRPIPVGEAAALSRQYLKSMVVILAWDPVHKLSHVTTFGDSAEDKHRAAAVGEEAAKLLGLDPEKRTTFEDFRAICVLEWIGSKCKIISPVEAVDGAGYEIGDVEPCALCPYDGCNQTVRRSEADEWRGRYNAAVGEWGSFARRMYRLLARFLEPTTGHAETCLANDRGRSEECNCHIADARQILEGAAASGDYDPEVL